MLQLIITTGDDSHQVRFDPGPSLREILDATSTRVRCGCRGNGLCGLCLVQIETGQVNPPTPHESLLLTPQQLDQQIRLACQVIPQQGLSIRIINPAAPSSWRSLPDDPLPAFRKHPPQWPHPAYGVAVDLGTTHISLTLWDLAQGVRVTGRIGQNPQSRYGSDIVTRLIAASESADNANRLADLALGAIHEAVQDICSRHGVDPGQIMRLVVVGNTAMMAILTRSHPEALLRPQSWTQEFPCQIHDLQAWVRQLGLHPQAIVEVVSPLAGFVGSDLLAGALATGLMDRPGSLLIDFGTNSEMALWDGLTLWVTSAAGGPAFEGCGIACGMPAEPGAVYRVSRNGDPASLKYEVIEGGPARGICGSGLVDLLAGLLRIGMVTPRGKFAEGLDGFALVEGDTAIRIDSKGIDLFQRAKAAIGAGTRTLLAHAQMQAEDLTRICVCGAFGRYLDIPNAQILGLLPALPMDRIELCGNTALRGCESLLLSEDAQADLVAVRRNARIVNLAQVPEFEALFLDCLYLRPLGGDPS